VKDGTCKLERLEPHLISKRSAAPVSDYNTRDPIVGLNLPGMICFREIILINVSYREAKSIFAYLVTLFNEVILNLRISLQ
jgi:hypothetical protein